MSDYKFVMALVILGDTFFYAFWFFVTLGATFEALFFLYLSDYQ
jgi:hypothetical protein